MNTVIDSPAPASHGARDPRAGEDPHVRPHYLDAILTAQGTRDARAVEGPFGSLTGRELVAAVHEATAVLAAAGVGPGVVVALLTAPAHHLMLVGRYAANRLGATVVHLRSMNPRTDTVELSTAAQVEVLRTAGASVLVTDLTSIDRGELLAQTVPGVRLVRSLAGAGGPVHLPEPDDSRCAVIDFTSGTTNAPRLVQQSFGGRARLTARLIADAVQHDATRFCSVTPISHTTGPMVDAVLATGGEAILRAEFDVEQVIRDVGSGVSDIYLAVPHLIALLASPLLAGADLRSLRRVTYSGTPIAPRRLAQAAAQFGSALVQVYGSTETGGITALTPADHQEPTLHDTVGRPFPWVELSIRDPANHLPVPLGSTGAVWVRSETTMDGYRTVVGTSGTIDGWVDTGDLGRMDAYGYLRLVGRQGGVIKHGGLKLYPETIEATLREHPAVADAVVHGVADSDRREHVEAVVTLRCGASATEGELADHVSAALTPDHAPTSFVFWRGIPVTDSGKPNRRLVRSILGRG